MTIATHSPKPEQQTRTRILDAAQRLFARQGYDGTTTRDLAQAAGVAEGTLFRHFKNKKAILLDIATQGWVDILTDLLTELSEMGSYRDITQVMWRRMVSLHRNGDRMRVCFMEAQFHPELRDRIQEDVIDKMTDVAEAFFETAMKRGVYRKMNPKIVAQVFLGMFVISGFSQTTIIEPDASPESMREMAEGMADIFLHGVLAKEGK
ncbi:TetR/AcrR family transcriptional regulator [Roseofilum casamattae]|uniref:TetR/AcrR family transcriptional regulator n=1 Tax=Roseofilum casamattae BLCC-M143 TaxID=3022442 RepID=A0ABT7BYM0_9CYAN|nr:TetR/AcrR family transcriptional regulator [Roseofilum casamattae]MDJ1184285.1 TetR/AcrR family transcriptional regulator [Roseofilum casamattae BLCC-M143]